jgi:flagellar assembly factor FliW
MRARTARIAHEAGADEAGTLPAALISAAREAKAIMQIATTRFGSVEVPEEHLIQFKNGIIGFPRESKFALIPHGQSTLIGWLQSAVTPALAFPVVSAHGLVVDYPDVPLDAVVEKAGLPGTLDDFAVLAVLCAPRGLPATVNLLAPLLVNSVTRQGAQVFLEGSRFTTRELFALPAQPSLAPPPPEVRDGESRPSDVRNGSGPAP